MHIQLESVDSTNSWARRNLSLCPADQSMIVVAQTQTAGRGRFGASWISPYGNLYLSLVQKMNPSLRIEDYPQACALALFRYIRTYGIEAAIKWPNDILVGEKKICGILIETAWQGMNRWVIMGIGLNCALREEEMQEATSLYQLLKRPVELKKVEQEVAQYVESMLAQFAADTEALRREYRQSISWMVGKKICCKTEQGRAEGRVVHIEENGCPLIELDSGERKTLSSISALTTLSMG